MRKPWEVIAELESDNSRLYKESVIEREAKAGNAEFFRGCRAASISRQLSIRSLAFDAHT